MTRNERIKRIHITRERRIRKARGNFYEFCQLLAPDYYLADRKHLELLCNKLQKLYQGELVNEDGVPYKKMRIHMPPQHGKSRTLIMFCAWTYGQNKSERIVACSYNDDKATEFSKYTRNIINKERVYPWDVIYMDVFPHIKIKHGDSSAKRWALEGEHLSYKGAGLDGSVTGTGGTIRIIDDPVKNAKIACNENALESIWQWYTGTFLSRAEGTPLDIILMTRWSDNDLIGRILKDPEESNGWYNLTLPAYNEKTGKMLCSDFLPEKRFLSLRRLMDPAIFNANYLQKIIEVEGRLYRALKTYRKIPRDEKGNKVWNRIISYGDTADQGSDYLCNIIAGEYDGYLYVLDVYYTKAPMEVTERKTAEMLVKNKTNLAVIESNSGGRGFARAVKRIIREKYGNAPVVVKWLHQSDNKISRINSMSAFVQENVLFPVGWHDRWPEFHSAIKKYSKEGKNAHDDAPDALTGLCEIMTTHKKARAVKSLHH